MTNPLAAIQKQLAAKEAALKRILDDDSDEAWGLGKQALDGGTQALEAHDAESKVYPRFSKVAHYPETGCRGARAVTHVYRWGARMRGVDSAHDAEWDARKGRQCRLVARGAFNSAWVVFEDGYSAIVSRNALRKIPLEMQIEPA